MTCAVYRNLFQVTEKSMCLLHFKTELEQDQEQVVIDSTLARGKPAKVKIEDGKQRGGLDHNRRVFRNG